MDRGGGGAELADAPLADHQHRLIVAGLQVDLGEDVPPSVATPDEGRTGVGGGPAGRDASTARR